MADDPFDLDKTGTLNDVTYETFGCDTFKANPETPDRLTPDVVFYRDVATGAKRIAPDGREIRFWAFEDPTSSIRDPFPAPLMRVRQGQIVHTVLNSKKNTHTIHHHGIEPTTYNDGVGHVSFEVSSDYTYQWYASEAGTNFYHCHKNTVLHFEMGMYGGIIIDPPEGPGRLFVDGPRYDVERLWVLDDVDHTWHLKEHDAGLCGEDAGLNVFKPDYFMINGVFAPRTLTDPAITATARPGQQVLLRIINASYSVLRCRIPVACMVWGADGIPLARVDAPWSKPFAIRANQSFELSTAQRYDLILTAPTRPGVYTCRFEFLDWITKEVQHGGRGVAEARIVVA